MECNKEDCGEDRSCESEGKGKKLGIQCALWQVTVGKKSEQKHLKLAAQKFHVAFKNQEV